MKDQATEQGFTADAPRLEEWIDPVWKDAGWVHDWRNYISEEVRSLWASFNDAQKAALYRQADEIAGNEEWD